jgi:GNAT superfamily N-acetyltransferase
MISYEWSDWRNGMLWWIQSVYVAIPHRRKGVFSAMYKHVESQAKADDGARGLRPYDDNSSNRAQETYQTLGIKKTGYLVMESIFATQGETWRC